MKVLVACEFSGVVREAFRALGHDAVSCDLDEAEDGGNHIRGDVTELLGNGWDLLVAHPPCTYLSNAGVRHLHEGVTSVNGVRAKIHGSVRWKAMQEGANFFLSLWESPIPFIAIENPVPHRYAKEIIGSYSQLIRPWEFGHFEDRATCLWLKGLPKLKATDVTMGNEHRIHMMSPGKDRAKNRSRTFSGIATAMAKQWGRVG